MQRIDVLKKLKLAHDEYFKLLLSTYPTKQPITEHSGFGDPRACELATEAQACLIALGSSAQNRMIRLGFDLLYPYNNIVDQYNWRSKIIADNISFTTFASIAIRIDSEIDIIEKLISMEHSENYDTIPESLFTQSKSRYTRIPSPNLDLDINHPPPSSDGSPDLIKEDADAEAINQIRKLEQKSNILSNLATVATSIKTLFL
ncbi:hypothetical protein [Pseudomonas mucidolens]|uniref:hypothetical protein n=1 Tax=Pseudomonas mucidolens TaxID=46679 RepID=UPI0030DC26E2